MTMRRYIAGGVVAGVLTAAAAGVGIAPAGADPGWKPDKDREWVDHDWRDRGGDWDKWWRANKWRNDDRPPWGWGPPPPLHWRGHPPAVIDYWGYPVRPVWDPGFRGWGFWLFGVFIPVVVI